jgi:hypothetical protein
MHAQVWIQSLKVRTYDSARLSKLWAIIFLEARPSPAGRLPLLPLRNSESYVVSLGAGQSVVTLAVAAGDECVVVACVVVVDCTVGLEYIINSSNRTISLRISSPKLGQAVGI